MSAPVGSFEQNQIQELDSQLEQYIQQVQNGGGSRDQFEQIHTGLMTLATNPRIPPEVQDNLLSALNQLKENSSSSALQAVKTQVGSLLEGDETEG